MVAEAKTQIQDYTKISEEEYLRYRELFRQKRENAALPESGIANYCAIYGSLPGKNVDAKSDLAVEVHQLFVNSTLNIRHELVVPDDFTQFKGAKNKNMV